MERVWLAAGRIGLVALAGGPVGVAGAWAQEAQVQAQAEEDDETLREMMVLSIPRESAGFYADLMELDALQREVALDMHRDYLGQYRDAAVAMRDFMRSHEAKMMESGANFEEAMGEMMRVGLAFMDRVVELGERYVDDLGALAATDAQRAGHDRVVRTREREMAVAVTSMGGGVSPAIDLIAIGRGLDPPLLPAAPDDGQGEEGQDHGPAARVLLEYESELAAVCGPFVDRSLSAFREMVRAAARDGMDAVREDTMEEEAQAMIERFASANERYARRVHAALPPDRQQAWDMAYKRARWPQVYAPGGFDRTHDAAMALDGLTAEQRETIAAAGAQYTREAERANRAWIGAIEEAEAAGRAMRNEWNEALWAEYQAKQQAATEAEAARKALDDRFAQRVMKALTPEQRAAMPALDGPGVDADEVVRQMGGG